VKKNIPDAEQTFFFPPFIVKCKLQQHLQPQNFLGAIMEHHNLPDFIAALLDPQMYPHPATDIRLVQTHISFVFIAGDFVYKLKKPVNFGFLDFSTLEKRQHCCAEELRLNRRLCPEIYLDLITLTKEGSGFALNGSGEVIEYGVKMARMPEEGMMGNLIRAGKLGRAQVDALVDTLIPFYQRAEQSVEIDGFGRAEKVAISILENFDQTQGVIGQGALSREQFDRISNWSRAFLAQEERFNRRITGGYIRDGHGDLYSANICLADKVYIFDCIEFNQRFRYCDVASDVAFLAMDLDFHGLHELSEYCIDRFSQLSGDSSLREMLNFYKCYRAYVRAKINLFTAADPAVDESVQAACTAAAAKYFALADSYVV
jgi:aminoglycoside phosphotransferase family enzyme